MRRFDLGPFLPQIGPLASTLCERQGSAVDKVPIRLLPQKGLAEAPILELPVPIEPCRSLGHTDWDFIHG